MNLKRKINVKYIYIYMHYEKHVEKWGVEFSTVDTIFAIIDWQIGKCNAETNNDENLRLLG